MKNTKLTRSTKNRTTKIINRNNKLINRLNEKKYIFELLLNEKIEFCEKSMNNKIFH